MSHSTQTLKQQLGWTMLVTVLALGLVAASSFANADMTAKRGDAWLAGEFDGSREEVQTLMDHYDAIELTPEQEKIRRDALGPVPAACCSNFSMATCCCECNLSRGLWGLSKYLITEKKASALQVRESVLAFVDVLNPEGYEGKTCQTGRCNLPFKKDGCGGMNKHRLIHE